jgi:uncharacterized membrane protein
MSAIPDNVSVPRPRFIRYHRLMMITSLLIIAVFLLFPPVTVLDKTHAIGYAICHQMPSRTFHIDGTPLPLCARCTGIYLGALMGLVGLSLSRRRRSIGLPATLVLLILVGFIGLMGIDGVNSYLSLFPGAPHLYEPQNWLRLTTGVFHGFAMSAIVFPVIIGSLWHPSLTRDEPVLRNLRDLFPFLVGGMVIILIVIWRHPLLLYPLTVLSTLGVMLMLTIVDTMFVLIITRREGYAHAWGDIVLPVTMGLAVSFLMIGGMDWLRVSITTAIGVPF